MPGVDDITILIAACNAAATIGRAIRSVTTQGPYSILLVDDFSTDDTISIAQHVGGSAVTVIRPPCHKTLGLTRQTGLEAVTTRLTMLLDADDELLPGRIERMRTALAKTGYEIFTDPIVLHNGSSGHYIRDMPIPGFLKKTPAPVRLFERNYLPGVGQIGFATKTAQRVGYDTALHGAEDIDFVLRLILAGARFHFDKTTGYRMHAHPSSLSRHLGNQRKMYRRCLKHYSYNTVKSLYLNHGESEKIALWGLVSIALFRMEYEQASIFLDQISSIEPANINLILEPDGPQPYPEQWRVSFHRGTIMLLKGHFQDAGRFLEEAYSLLPLPETCNNLALAYKHMGFVKKAIALLQQALSQHPDYLDAQSNLLNFSHHQITTHPLRYHASRLEYHQSTAKK